MVKISRFKKLKVLGKRLKDVTVSNDVKVIEESKLFDKVFYESQAGKKFTFLSDAIKDYLNFGWKKNLDPHPLFSTSYYLKHNPDIKEAKLNPLTHYIQFGHEDYRAISPLFNVNNYYNIDPNLKKNKVNPLLHYIEYSNQYPNHVPNRFFNNQYYLNNNIDLKESNTVAYPHYLQYGKEEGRHPNPMWDRLNNQAASDSDSPLFRGNWRSGKVVLVSHQAGRTGAPLIILKIAEFLANTYHFEIITIVLEGGELVKEFRDYSSHVYDLSTIENYKKYDQEDINALIHSLVPKETLFTLINSAASNDICRAFSELNIPFYCLTHEFADPFHPDKFASVLDARKLIVPSQIVRQSIEKKYNREFDNLIVRGQGVLGNNFGSGNPITANNKVRIELGINQTTKLVLGSGYVHGRKGKDVFYHVALNILQNYQDVDICFCWVGHYDPSDFDKLEYWINYDRNHLELWDKIKFIGAKPNVEDYFLAADIFFLPARMDPFPCVVLEAMACKLPVVCFEDAIGSSEIIAGGGETIIPYMNITAISDAIVDLAMDMERAHEIGMENYNIVQKDYQYDDYVSDLLDIIQEDKGESLSFGRMIESKDLSQTKPKLIALSCDWGLSGVNAALEALGTELIDRGVEFKILFTQNRDVVKRSCKADEDKYLMTDLPHDYIPEDSKTQQQWWANIIASIEKEAPCVVLTTYDFTGTCIVPALSNNVGVITWVQSDDPDYYEQSNRIGRYVNNFAVVSDFLAQSIGALNSHFKDKIEVIYNSTIKRADICPERTDMLKSEKLRMIYTGRLVQYQKRVLDFIEIVGILDQLGIDYVLTLAGQDTTGGEVEGPIKEILAKQIKEGKVVLTGRLNREELFEELRRHDFFMLLSDFEGLPLSLGEGMSQGCIPIVSKMKSGINELVLDDVTGYQLETRNYEEWVQLLMKLFNDKQKMLDLSNASRAHIEKNITLEASADKFITLINDIHNKIVNKSYIRPETIKSHNKFGDVLANQYVQKV